MAQIELHGMPRRLFACTPSRLTTWLDCPRRYRMTYVDRPMPAKGAPWAHNSLGASVHLALARWWSLSWRDRTPAAGRRLVHDVWVADGFRDDDQSSTWRERAGDMTADYLREVDPGAEPAGVERTVGMPTDGLALSGRVDRIDQRGDELVIVDYKTGRSVPGDDDARGSLALALYALAAARVFRRRTRRVELHHVPTGSVASFEHTDESLARQLRRAEGLGAEAAEARERFDAGAAADEAFPPRPGRQCAWCDFVAHCPEGRAVSAPERPWGGLADDRVAPGGDADLT